MTNFITGHRGWILAMLSTCPLYAEQLTLTTQFPSPLGAYKEMRTSGNTYLATNPGTVVGIGTAGVTSGKLDIRGVTQVTDAVFANPDTSVYASFGVTRDNVSQNLSYIGLTKAGIFPWGIGIDSTNNLIIGAAASGRAIPTPLFVMKPNGAVGIGTSMPAQMFDVVGGALRVVQSAANQESQFIHGGTYLHIRANDGVGSAGNVRLGGYKTGEGWKDLILNEGGGAVGIGTANPAAKLHIQGGSFRVNHPSGIDESTIRHGNTYMFLRAVDGAGTAGNVRLGGYNSVDGWKNLVLNEGAAGNVGIGTPTPVQKLHVEGGAYLSGNVGIGTDASQFRRLSVFDDASTGDRRAMELVSDKNAGGEGLFVGAYGHTTAGTNIAGDFLAANNNGGLQVGVKGWASGVGQKQGGYFQADGAGTNYGAVFKALNGTENRAGDFVAAGGTNNWAVFIGGGGAWNPNGPNWSSPSDIRLKKNIKTLEGSLDRLLKLRGVTFEWKDPKKHDNRAGTQMGLIAQEVEKVIPEWIQDGPDGFKAINPRGMDALTIESFKELILKFNSLESENESLKLRLDGLEKKQASRP